MIFIIAYLCYSRNSTLSKYGLALNIFFSGSTSFSSLTNLEGKPMSKILRISASVIYSAKFVFRLHSQINVPEIVFFVCFFFRVVFLLNNILILLIIWWYNSQMEYFMVVLWILLIVSCLNLLVRDWHQFYYFHRVLN